MFFFLAIIYDTHAYWLLHTYRIRWQFMCKHFNLIITTEIIFTDCAIVTIALCKIQHVKIQIG